MKSFEPSINLHLHSIHNLSIRFSPETPLSMKVYFDDDEDLVQHTTDPSLPTKNSTVTFLDDTTANITLSLCSAARAHNAKSNNPRMIVKAPRFMTLSVHAHPSILSPEKSAAIAIGKVELKTLKRRNKTSKTTAQDIPLSVAGTFVRMTASLSVTGVYVRMTVSLAVFVKKGRNSEQDGETSVGDTTHEPETISSIEETSSEGEEVVVQSPEDAQNQRNMARENSGWRVLRWTTTMMNIVTGVDESAYMDVLESSSDNELVNAVCGKLKAAKAVVKSNAYGVLGDGEYEDQDQDQDQEQDEGECQVNVERGQVDEIKDEVTTQEAMGQLRMELLASTAEEVIEQKVDEMRESSNNNSVTPHPTNQNLVKPTPIDAHQTAITNIETSTNPNRTMSSVTETANTVNEARDDNKKTDCAINATAETSSEEHEGWDGGLLHFATQSVRKLSNMDVSTSFTAFEKSVRKEWDKRFGGIDGVVEVSSPGDASSSHDTGKGENEGLQGDAINGKRTDESEKNDVLDGKDDNDDPECLNTEQSKLNYVLKQLSTGLQAGFSQAISSTHELLKKIEENRKAQSDSSPTAFSSVDTLDERASVTVHVTATTDGTNTIPTATKSMQTVTENTPDVIASTNDEIRRTSDATANLVNTTPSSQNENICVSNAKASTDGYVTTANVDLELKKSTVTLMSDETNRSVKIDENRQGMGQGVKKGVHQRRKKRVRPLQVVRTVVKAVRVVNKIYKGAQIFSGEE